ncbi:MAG TPA: endonuclease/exonuclease/phosphatase family protein [Methylomirabilota bacterium]|nr:endonuclease/exonuclease/phosphatase family protein [Methylomirabilota bacterium]
MGSVPLPALVAAVCLLAALAGGRVAAAEPASTLRVVTFNLLHGGPASGWRGDGEHLEERLALVTREFAALEPDVVGLQEASIARGHGNVAARLGTALGLHWAHASATGRITGLRWLDRVLVWGLGFEEGPAILSRFPIVETSVVDLPRCRRFYDPRVLLRATLDTPRGRLDVYSTHTGHDACQARRVAEVVRARRGTLPALIMGDFNAADTAEWIQALAREHGFVDAYRAARPSDPGATVWQQPGAAAPTVTRRVDFIFVVSNGALGAAVRASRVVLDTPARRADGSTLWPSDHYGVLAELEWPRP